MIYFGEVLSSLWGWQLPKAWDPKLENMISLSKRLEPENNERAYVRAALRWLNIKVRFQGLEAPEPLMPGAQSQLRPTGRWWLYLVELDPLLRLLGAGVGNPQGPELGPEEVGGVSLHGGHVEAENLGGEFGTVEQIVWRRNNNNKKKIMLGQVWNFSF